MLLVGALLPSLLQLSLPRSRGHSGLKRHKHIFISLHERGLMGSFDDIVARLKAAAEPTRLRILRLLLNGEFNVKDLTQLLGQSQPRVSRHIKLLAEAGLIERYQEGSWVFVRGSADAASADSSQRPIDDRGGRPQIARDSERADQIRAARRCSLRPISTKTPPNGIAYARCTLPSAMSRRRSSMRLGRAPTISSSTLEPERAASSNSLPAARAASSGSTQTAKC